MGDTSLVVDFLTGKDDVIKRMDELDQRVMKIGNLTAKGLITTEGASKRINDLKSQFGPLGGTIDRTFKAGTRSAGQFDMRMLSILFGGMALQRAFGGILRSITTTFLKAEGDTSALTVKTTELTAAWEFFKFSLFDALNTDFFINVIDGVINLVNWFGRMNDGAKTAILGVVVGLATLGTGLMLIGQISLGWNSIFGVGGFLAGKNTTTAGLKQVKGGVQGIGSAINEIAGKAFGFWLIWEGIKDFQEDDISGAIGNVLTGIIAWNAGLGVAIPFFLVFKGLQFGVPKFQEELGKAKALENLFPEESILGILGARAGVTEGSFLGKILGIGPGLRDQIDVFYGNLKTKTGDAKTSSDGLAKTFDEQLNPAIGTNASIINDSLVPGLNDTIDNMTIINDTITPSSIDSADIRINSTEAETDAILARNKALQEWIDLNTNSERVGRGSSTVIAEGSP